MFNDTRNSLLIRVISIDFIDYSMFNFCYIPFLDYTYILNQLIWLLKMYYLSRLCSGNWLFWIAILLEMHYHEMHKQLQFVHNSGWPIIMFTVTNFTMSCSEWHEVWILISCRIYFAWVRIILVCVRKMLKDI